MTNNNNMNFIKREHYTLKCCDTLEAYYILWRKKHFLLWINEILSSSFKKNMIFFPDDSNTLLYVL